MPVIEERALAKVNLDLHVTGRRADGYHELDSLVVFAEPSDGLLFQAHDQLTLELAGPFAAALAGRSDNLVLDAARRLAALAGREPTARIHLDKRIPVAAGLGGGSADAAAALRGLNRLWNLGLTPCDLMPIAAGLGADVPVCLMSRPTRMRGMGERLEAVVGLPELALLLVNPKRPVSTAAVFAGLAGITPLTRPDEAPPQERADLFDWLRTRANHLEAPARALEPAIERVLAVLAESAGCALARMSGSGATCFALFDDDGALRAAAAAIEEAHPHWWVASSRTGGS